MLKPKNFDKDKEHLWIYLKVYAVGHKNAKVQDQITKAISFDGAYTRALIHALRTDDKPVFAIASAQRSGGGYFVASAQDMEACSHCINQLYSRAEKIIEIARPLYHWYKVNYSQSIKEVEHLFEQQTEFKF